MAKEQGISTEERGSMHLSVPYKGLMWTSAIVGTGVPVACGIAEALSEEKMERYVQSCLGTAQLRRVGY